MADSGIGGSFNTLFALDRNTIAAGTSSGLCISTDGGDHWRERDSGIVEKYVTCLATDGTAMYAANNMRFYRSLDGGVHWIGLNNGLPDSPSVQSIAATREAIYLAGGREMYVSTNQGTVWSIADNGLPKWSASALAATERSAVCATDTGVYITTDRGAHWRSFGDGLPVIPYYQHPLYRLFVDSADFYLARSTDSLTALFHRAAAEGTSRVEHRATIQPAISALDLPFPDPFVSSATIPFSVSHSAHAHLAVYDVLGNCVATIIDGNVTSGLHTAVFRADDVRSGVYVVRLKVDGEVHMAPVVRVR